MTLVRPLLAAMTAGGSAHIGGPPTANVAPPQQPTSQPGGGSSGGGAYQQQPSMGYHPGQPYPGAGQPGGYDGGVNAQSECTTR